MSARPSRRHASKTDQAKQRLEQLKRLKEDAKKRLDDIDGDEDVANVYDEVRSPFPSSSSSSSSFFADGRRGRRESACPRQTKKQH